MDQPQFAQQIQQLLSYQGGQQETVKFSSKLLDDFDYSDEESSPRIQGSGGAGGSSGGGDKGPEIPPQTFDALAMIMSSERGIQQLKQSGHVSDSQIQQLQMLLSARQQQQHSNVHSFMGSSHLRAPSPTTMIPTGPADINPQFMQQSGHLLHHSVDLSQPPPPKGSGMANMPPWGQVPNNQMQDNLAAPLIDISMEGGREDNLSDIEVIDDRDGGWNERGGGGRGDKSGSRRGNKDNRDGGRRNRRSSRSRSRSRDRGKRNGNRRRSRSRSPHVGGDRHRRDRRDKREEDKREEEKRREREKKGLPPIRKGFLSGKHETR